MTDPALPVPPADSPAVAAFKLKRIAHAHQEAIVATAIGQFFQQWPAATATVVLELAEIFERARSGGKIDD
jgi:hypothetical protein